VRSPDVVLFQMRGSLATLARASIAFQDSAHADLFRAGSRIAQLRIFASGTRWVRLSP
jgi:hypothetical protein